MKVTLDIDKLIENGEIDQNEYDKLKRLSSEGTSALAFNVLIGFGVISLSAGVLAFVENFIFSAFLGLAVMAVGIGIIKNEVIQWSTLAQICLIVGALMFGGGLIGEFKGEVVSFLVTGLVFAFVGVLARSGLLVTFAVLLFSSCLGARTGYFHASYFLGVEEPALTALVFTLFSGGAYFLSKQLDAELERLAIIASRTGVFIVNLAFWIGSLWGDERTAVDEDVFAVVWGLALLGVIVWAWKNNRRWLVNTAAVFAGIHLYTQFFETLGANPTTLLVAGFFTLIFAMVIKKLNSKLVKVGAE